MTTAAVDLLTAAYSPLIAFAEAVDEEQGWRATQLPGWTVRDLIWHLTADGQRALVALATPAAAGPDTDEVSYWTEWQPGTAGAQAGLRGTRIMASAWTSVRGPAGLYAETARAVLHVAARADLDQVVTTQGRVLRIGALLRTLAVEAAIHHLDLAPALPEPPQPAVLAEVRRVLDELLGEHPNLEWTDSQYARAGTGRQPLTDEERAALGPLADRFPLFG